MSLEHLGYGDEIGIELVLQCDKVTDKHHIQWQGMIFFSQTLMGLSKSVPRVGTQGQGRETGNA